MATTQLPTRPATTVLPHASPESLGLDPSRLEQLYRLIEAHIAEGRYPGAGIAIARKGKIAVSRTFGRASIEPSRPAGSDTVWLLFSQTKVVIAATVWTLVDRGALRFSDKIADLVPGFEKNGKGEITLFEVLTHQGGFPSASVGRECWEDHEKLRQAVCDFSLSWTPGSQVSYHGTSAHWVAAVVIEALTGRDFRDVVRTELLDPIGLADIFVGVPEEAQGRCADLHNVRDGQMVVAAAADSGTGLAANSVEFRKSGMPGGGGYASAEAMVTLYQLFLAGGALNGVRVLSPRVIEFATRNQTGDRVDLSMGMPMHRGLGPHLRGLTPTIRGLGTLASPRTFGHGGAGTSYSWADPESGVSFTYLTNCSQGEPWHTQRLDTVSNLVHAAIVEP